MATSGIVQTFRVGLSAMKAHRAPGRPKSSPPKPRRCARAHTKAEVGDVDKVLDGFLDPFIHGYLLMKRQGGVPVAAGPDDDLD
jgi:hypothetical protein